MIGFKNLRTQIPTTSIARCLVITVKVLCTSTEKACPLMCMTNLLGKAMSDERHLGWVLDNLTSPN